jgi:cysteinyl-tRNA synthetase
VLGLGLAHVKKHTTEIPDQISQLLTQRNKARAEKNWKESDVLRAQIEALGYTIKDTADGTKITKQ